MTLPTQPLAAPGPPLQDVEEAQRRHVRSIASLVEIARQIQSGEAAGKVRRQILIATMGVLDAEGGAVFRAEPDGGLRLVEILGTRETLRPGVLFPPDERIRAILEKSGPYLYLGDDSETEPWRSLTRQIDPDFSPRVVIPLAGADRRTGFILLSDVPALGVGANQERSRYSAVAGLIGIINTAQAAAAGARRATPPGSRLGEMTATPTKIEELCEHEPALRRFVGTSPAIERIFYDVIAVAGTNCPVLFEGESGTGKEQLARIIHQIACGESAPFEAVNCGAIPEALVESELFGHVLGAFTGAHRAHRGVFERASGGTVFLDEIGDMPAAAQVKLLRVLQENAFAPVGGEELRRCTCRIIAATHRDLRREVESGRFRQDLFYRLSVFPIRIPPLRERPEDIPVLVRELLAQSAAEHRHAPLEISEDAVRRLSIYSFPGNVRELQNIVRTLLVEARGSRITDDHVAAVFSRHRVGEAARLDGTAHASAKAPTNGEDAGTWVLAELRRYFFNLALAERMLEDRRRATGDKRGVPVFSRSGLTYYFQGECLRALAEETWDRQAAAARVAGSDRMTLRVRRALDHLLSGARTVLQQGGTSPESRLQALQGRFAKLPEPYHVYVRRLAERHESGRWP